MSDATYVERRRQYYEVYFQEMGKAWRQHVESKLGTGQKQMSSCPTCGADEAHWDDPDKRSETPIDYRDLLKRYMAIVLEIEGVGLTGHISFSAAETAAMNNLLDEHWAEQERKIDAEIAHHREEERLRQEARKRKAGSPNV